uniref:Zinc finger protein 830 n=1 Tax=Salvator merianae TaxID=96440 RepID=A0A8D0BY79_SALMN
MLCNMPVKSELLWQTHVLGKQHKEKVEQLKGTKQSVLGPNPETSLSLKRKTTDTETPSLKKVTDSSNNLQSVSSGLGTKSCSQIEEEEAGKLSKATNCGLILGTYKDEEEVTEQTEKQMKDTGKPPLPSVVQNASISSPSQKGESTDALPAEPLDNRALGAPLIFHSGSIQKAEAQEKVVERRENTAEALPEGFFDDPEVDAKVRKVDAPKDQMDKEWDEFQKAMRQVNTISEAIVAEEDEEGRLDRQIGEIDEQIECFRRVEQLRDRQEIMKNKLKEVVRLRAARVEDDAIGSDDEEELQDLLSQDWRAKGTAL